MDATKTGNYLAMLRKMKGMTQQEIADRLGVSNKTVSKWESGGGFPDITVLPALAELYGVTADDILAGETLTARRRVETAAETTAQKKRLLVRLRTRFDVCFAAALGLAVVAVLEIYYLGFAALPLSVATLWVGYALAANPLRYGSVEANGTLWQNLYRKMLAASILQWYALLRMMRFGQLEVEKMVYSGDWMKSPLFLLGALLLWLMLEWSGRRVSGQQLNLLPRWLAPWVIWSIVFLTLWLLADRSYQQAAELWIQRYGEDFMSDPRFDTIWPKAKVRRDAEVLPYLRARWAVLAAGGVSGLGLLGRTLWRMRKKDAAPLAQGQE